MHLPPNRCKADIKYLDKTDSIMKLCLGTNKSKSQMEWQPPYGPIRARPKISRKSSVNKVPISD